MRLGNIQNGSGSVTQSTVTNSGNSVASQTTTTNNPNQSQTQSILSYVNPMTKRVLGFLANILCYAPIKVAFLSIIHGKIYEHFIKVLTVKSNAIPANLLPILNQEQESILMIFHTILNVDISLVGNFDYGINAKTLSSPDVILGCSLPPKDCLIGITTSIFDWFFNADDSLNTTGCQFAAMKTMTLLTNYE